MITDRETYINPLCHSCFWVDRFDKCPMRVELQVIINKEESGKPLSIADLKTIKDAEEKNCPHYKSATD